MVVKGLQAAADFPVTVSASDYALNVLVNNVRALRLEPHANGANVIGGCSGNHVTGGLHGATIGSNTTSICRW